MAQGQDVALTLYVNVMRLLGAIYAIGVVLFLFFPNLVFFFLDIGPNYVFTGFDPLPQSTEHFWVPLAGSMMVMLTITAFGQAKDPMNKVLPMAHMASKLCTSVMYLYYFFFFEGYFAYLIGTATDLPIFFLVLWLTRRMYKATAV
jgi:hypothetical protein